MPTPEVFRSQTRVERRLSRFIREQSGPATQEDQTTPIPKPEMSPGMRLAEFLVVATGLAISLTLMLSILMIFGVIIAAIYHVLILHK